MGFVAWLALAAALVFLSAAVRGTSPLETARAILQGEPATARNTAHVIGDLRQEKTPAGSTGGTGGLGLVMPVTGTVTSPYGPRNGRMHHGVDIAASTGTPVRAAAAGTVAVAGWRGGYGQAVYLEHGGGIATRYAHLSSIIARTGQTVGQGQTIGAVGSTGDSSGPHLHFEVRINGASTDPMPRIGVLV